MKRRTHHDYQTLEFEVIQKGYTVHAEDKIPKEK